MCAASLEKEAEEPRAEREGPGAVGAVGGRCAQGRAEPKGHPQRAYQAFPSRRFGSVKFQVCRAASRPHLPAGEKFSSEKGLTFSTSWSPPCMG